MNAKNFLALDYSNQLKTINRSGKLKLSIIANDHQITVYKVNDFYVELKRSIKELFFEKITPMYYDDLPLRYKEACKRRFWF